MGKEFAKVKVSKRFYVELLRGKIKYVRKAMEKEAEKSLKNLASSLRTKKTFWTGKPKFDAITIDSLEKMPIDYSQSLYYHPLFQYASKKEFFRMFGEYDWYYKSDIERIKLDRLETEFDRLTFVGENDLYLPLSQMPTYTEAQKMGIEEFLKNESQS